MYVSKTIIEIYYFIIKSSDIIMGTEKTNEIKYLDWSGTEILVDKVKELIGDVRKEIENTTGSDSSQSFTLNPATEDLLGGIKVGSNLEITGDGILTAKGYTWDETTNTMTITSNSEALGNIVADGGFHETSDARKKDIQGELPLDKAYDFIRNCEPILYNLKGSDKTQIGLIAQEVREFFPEIVNEDSEGYLSLDYAKLTVIILRVLKDLIDKK